MGSTIAILSALLMNFPHWWRKPQSFVVIRMTNAHTHTQLKSFLNAFDLPQTSLDLKDVSQNNPKDVWITWARKKLNNASQSFNASRKPLYAGLAFKNRNKKKMQNEKMFQNELNEILYPSFLSSATFSSLRSQRRSFNDYSRPGMLAGWNQKSATLSIFRHCFMKAVWYGSYRKFS